SASFSFQRSSQSRKKSVSVCFCMLVGITAIPLQNAVLPSFTLTCPCSKHVIAFSLRGSSKTRYTRNRDDFFPGEAITNPSRTLVTTPKSEDAPSTLRPVSRLFGTPTNRICSHCDEERSSNNKPSDAPL